MSQAKDDEAVRALEDAVHLLARRCLDPAQRAEELRLAPDVRAREREEVQLRRAAHA